MLEEPVRVHNFEVADWYTYYVSEEEVPVHDDCTARQGGNERRTLYHYTNKKGMEGIVDSQKLNPSLKANNLKDARYTGKRWGVCYS